MQSPESIATDLPPENGTVALEDVQVCPNCSAERVGPFCQACGQRYTTRLAPLTHLLPAVLTTALNLDNKLFSTLRLLFFKPGALTNAYLAGQRVRFIPPLRLYLLFSVVYFFVAAFTDATSFLFIRLNSVEGAAEFAEFLPKIMFVIVPGFALLLMGLFRRPRRFFVEHLVFALHIFAVWYVLFLVRGLLQPLAQPALDAPAFPWLMLPVVILHEAAQLAIPVYLFMAMRRVYGQSRSRTLWKLVLLLLGYMVLLGVVTFGYLALR